MLALNRTMVVLGIEAVELGSLLVVDRRGQQLVVVAHMVRTLLAFCSSTEHYKWVEVVEDHSWVVVVRSLEEEVHSLAEDRSLVVEVHSWAQRIHSWVALLRNYCSHKSNPSLRVPAAVAVDGVVAVVAVAFDLVAYLGHTSSVRGYPVGDEPAAALRIGQDIVQTATAIHCIRLIDEYIFWFAY